MHNLYGATEAHKNSQSIICYSQGVWRPRWATNPAGTVRDLGGRTLSDHRSFQLSSSFADRSRKRRNSSDLHHFRKQRDLPATLTPVLRLVLPLVYTRRGLVSLHHSLGELSKMCGHAVTIFRCQHEAPIRRTYCKEKRADGPPCALVGRPRQPKDIRVGHCCSVQCCLRSIQQSKDLLEAEETNLIILEFDNAVAWSEGRPEQYLEPLRNSVNCLREQSNAEVVAHNLCRLVREIQERDTN